MNVNQFPRVLVGAAIVGLVGAAGMFIYEQVYAEKRRAMLARDVARLDNQVSTMRSELEALIQLQKEVQLRRQKHKKNVRQREQRRKVAAGGDAVDGAEQSYASDSEYFTDYQSVLGTDGEMESEEFFDVHTDEEDDTLRERNGHATSGSDLDEDLSLPADSPNSSPRNSTKK